MTVIGVSCALSTLNEQRPKPRQMHATTAQLSNHSGAEKSKPRVLAHILAIALVAVVVLAAEAVWVALLGYGLIFLFS